MSLIKELAISLPIVIIIAIIGAHLVVVPTNSMSPNINEGDLVLVEKTDMLGLMEEFNPESVKTGDIIIYAKTSGGNSHSDEGSSNVSGENTRSSSELVIHRVVEVNESNGIRDFIMKGDNNTQKDKTGVSAENIIGRVLTWGNDPIKIPQVGWVVLWFNSYFGAH